jgi:predicted nuclease with TOPRIM domain
MTKDEARLSVMGAISMALKDSTLQQGFEIICKNLSELEKEKQALFESNCNVRSKLRTLRNDYEVLDTHHKLLTEENAELKETITKINNVITETFSKLIKAKELLNEFMRISKASDEDFEHDYTELIAEAEQFISEVKK